MVKEILLFLAPVVSMLGLSGLALNQTAPAPQQTPASQQGSASQGQVILQTAWQDAYTMTVGGTNTLHAIIQNMTGNEKSALVTLQLYDEHDNQLASRTYNRVSMEPYNIATLTLASPKNLSEGTYTWRVKISDMQTNNNALQFTVSK